MVRDQSRRSDVEIRVDRAGRVRQHDRPAPGRDRQLDRSYDDAGIVTLVEMEPAGEHQHALAAEVSRVDLAFVPDDAYFWEAFDELVGDPTIAEYRSREGVEARAQNDRDVVVRAPVALAIE